MKKGRHRRYEEARRFQRSSTFDLEEFDLDAPDPFALPETGVEEDDDQFEDEDDKYAELARKYADFDDSDSKSDDAR
ncbi:MAG: hypothetical protein GY708_04610 [Actinomycetia bacterium]|nr:hypothetical protein [Actinomycetes bacterium]MCP4963028.1 hypothetical protein [Actinomycetes bacterium]